MPAASAVTTTASSYTGEAFKTPNCSSSAQVRAVAAASVGTATSSVRAIGRAIRATSRGAARSRLFSGASASCTLRSYVRRRQGSSLSDEDQLEPRNHENDGEGSAKPDRAQPACAHLGANETAGGHGDQPDRERRRKPGDSRDIAQEPGC